MFDKLPCLATYSKYTDTTYYMSDFCTIPIKRTRGKWGKWLYDKRMSMFLPIKHGDIIIVLSKAHSQFKNDKDTYVYILPLLHICLYSKFSSLHWAHMLKYYPILNIKNAEPLKLD